MKFDLSKMYEKLLSWITTNGFKLVIGLILLIFRYLYMLLLINILNKKYISY